MYQVFNIAATIVISVICVILATVEILKRLHLNGTDRIDKLLKWSNASIVHRISLLLERFWFIPAIIVAVLFAYSRFRDLGVLPYGIHIDEIGMLHDARDLATYGTDRYGHAWPVYLQNYGGGMGPMYAYLTSVVLRFFPMTFKYMRLSSVVVACIGCLAMFGIGIEITGKKMGGTVLAFVFTIFPSVMMMNRWDCDCHLIMSLTAMSLFLFLHAIKTDKIIWYVLSSISFGVGMYTYLIACLVYPVFLVLAVAYMLWTKRLNVKNFCAMFFPVVITALPLFVAQVVNMRLIPEFSLWGTDFFVFAPDRVGETKLSNIPKNLGVIFDELIHGDTLIYNAFEEFGAIYTFLMPLVLFGLFMSVLYVVDAIKNKKLNGQTMCFLFAFSGYIMALTHEWPNLNRYQELFIPISIFIMIAVFEMVRRAELIGYGVILVCAIGFAFFADFYFNKQLELYPNQFLFAEPDVYNVMFFVTNFIDPGCEQNLYLQIPYDKDYLADCIVPAAGMVSPEDWWNWESGQTENLGRIHFGFPSEFDENEQAVYVLGHDWDHISNYLISIGFKCDETIPSMRILWR